MRYFDMKVAREDIGKNPVLVSQGFDGATLRALSRRLTLSNHIGGSELHIRTGLAGKIGDRLKLKTCSSQHACKIGSML